ncbi:dipeptidyl aminopeptidase/acylaminoacyl peptidase [Spinactinospora alkalitolerans]|uniref:Dipeptidyl aminopeptidase/acylaminoacyl peptidase n=1 Tax=Spinactinospora alkalitolerans TaxID=687207 RepID=A0A852U2Y1_9ACTN|nr:prolyl oligopeptidase family serine peptidase [Spinactinospora alkalitolerans]NYE50559.1 dipeptidyl aminopeptidase/acylaminoacyl peptidase [Spinactinospora alkalitolerans]
MGERWQDRFRAARISLPSSAREAPDRGLFRSNASGTWEIYAWDRTTGEQRQVTKRHQGTMSGVIDPTGTWAWWFDDTDGDEFGVWRRQPFTGGPDETAAPGLAPSYAGGLALGASGAALVGRSTDDGFSVHLSRPGAQPQTLYAHRQEGYLADLSRDESLFAIGHSEHGDSRHMAVRVLRLGAAGTAEAVADLWDGPHRDLTPVGFAPDDHRLLVLHERRGRLEPLIWDAVAGIEREIAIDLPGDLLAGWYLDGRSLLISQDHQARSQLHRYDLDTGELVSLDVPRGLVSAAAARPDGTVEYSWSSSARPPVIRSTTGAVVLAPPGPEAPASVPVRDVTVAGPGGDIHALVSLPEEGAAPHPTVFIVHGGPQAQDFDSFAPDVAAWVDHGFAVVRVNYRGSTGYGSAWRDALEGRVGLTELEDIKAVRDWAVGSGLSDPDRMVLEGGSWGGYLALLGIGRHPGDWSAGIAAVPIADYVAAYEDEMEALRAFDRSLFGGSPQDVPDLYRASSPITYAADVTAPVLVLAGENDPRCPIRQIDNYIARLAELGRPHEVHRFDAGHGSFVVEERIRHMAAELDFALRSTGLRTEGTRSGHT